MSLLSTRGLTRDFGGLRAVDQVDLDVQDGEIRAIIGPNGAGKTTLVGLICGRLRPSAGAVWFAGEDVTGLPAHRRVQRGIAYTFQITSVFPGLTAYDNVALAAQRRPAGGGLEKSTMAALERVGLAGHAGQTAGTLSYGHQRLLELAMGLALAPRLLILDEPTQGLADSEIADFERLIREIVTGTTVLLIEHNMPVVMGLAHRITVLEAGRVLAEGAPEAIRGDPAVQTAYLGA